MSTEMQETDVVAFLGRKIEQAINEDDGDISEKRKNLVKAYMGDHYGDERAGYSKVVTREVLETVEWAKPGLLRIFANGDRVVSFVPVGPDDEELSGQETDVVRHILFERNNGFLTLLSWFHDALMYPNGYAKVWADKTEEAQTEEYADLTVDELGQLLFDTDDEVEPLENEETPQGTYNLKLRRTVRDVRIRFEPCEPDQVLIDNDLAELSLEEADFVCHRVRRSFTWLVNNGIDEDELRETYTNNEEDWGDERTNRLFYEDENPNSDSDDDDSMREYWVHECYVRLDFDGDGIAERRRILMIGDKIFENEEDDYIPIIPLSCIPQPHKHTGVSLADLAESHQRIQTVLTRNLLDNIYRSAVPRKFMGEGAERADGTTEDDLQDADAEVIRVRDVAQIREEEVPNKSVEILQVMQEITEQQKTRTGVAPEISLDPSVLKESTMGAFMGAQEEANARLELVARVFAETGVKDAMYKAHRLMREHMDKQEIVRLRGEWVQIDPSSWRERKDLVVEVGTGFKSHERRIHMTHALLKEQKEALQMGLPSVQPENVYRSQLDLADAMGQRNPNRFFTDPATIPPPPPPPPDPQMMAIEAQKQIESEKRRVELVKAENERQAKTLEFQLKAKQAELDAHSKLSESAHKEGVDFEKLRLEREANQLKEQAELLRFEAGNADRQLQQWEAEVKYAIEEAKLNQSAEPSAPEAPKIPEVHIHNDGKRHVSVQRTENGIEGFSEPV